MPEDEERDLQAFLAKKDLGRYNYNKTFFWFPVGERPFDSRESQMLEYMWLDRRKSWLAGCRWPLNVLDIIHNMCGYPYAYVEADNAQLYEMLDAEGQGRP